MELTEKSCVPCRGGIPAMTKDQAEKMTSLTLGWELFEDAKKIRHTYEVTDFVQALKLVELIAELAETEGHHPDITFGWGYCTVVFYTHKIGGLHENDFIMAAKVNELAKEF